MITAQLTSAIKRFLLAGLLLASSAWAQTPAQLITLKAAILAETDPAFVIARSVRNDTFMAAFYSAPAVPSLTVWRSSVPQDEIMQNGFDWARVDNLSVGKARIWEWLFDNSSRSFNPSKLNVRAGIDAVWSVTAQDLAVRAAVYVHCKRFANRAEKLFATGTGTDAAPATMAFEGDISPSLISSILN